MIAFRVSRGSMLWGDYNWVITSELANQRAPKALFTSGIYYRVNNNTWARGDTEFLFSCLTQYELNTREGSRFYSRFKKINPSHSGLRMDKAFVFINEAK